MSRVILGCGNPLLDISANVPHEVLDRYGLLPGNAVLAEEKHLPLYEELVEKYDVEYIAGGATQNSIRVCQWMLQESGHTAYVGCVGDDKFARELRNAASHDGVEVHYMVSPSHPTGTCAVCIVGKERSLVANLSAANDYKIEHMMTPELQGVLQRADICYSAGFFLTVSPDTALYVAKHCAENNKTYCLNLAAPFIIEFFGQHVAALMPYTDFLFANDDEARKYGEVNNLEDKSVHGVARHISKLPKINASRPRIVVFTQGRDPTVVCIDGEITEYPVVLLDPAKIVDTNGAGDSFVGGFLSQLYHGKDVAECVRAGQYAASIIIQHSGCTFPPKPSFE